jgi:hypothetical protein
MRSKLKETGLIALAALTGLCAVVTAAFAEGDWQAVRKEASAIYGQTSPSADEALDRAEKEGVPAGDVAMILSHASAVPLEDKDFSELIDRVATAKKDGVPTLPFTEKIVEGFAKKVPTPLIVSVLDHKLETYREAKGIIGDLAKKGEAGDRALTSVAIAMERGVSPEALKEISSSSKDPDTVNHSAQALADLEAMGFPEKQGARVVQAGMKSGYLSYGHSTFIRVVAEARKSGRSYGDIAETMEVNLGRGRSLSETAVSLQGNRGLGVSGREGGPGSGPKGMNSIGGSHGRGKR